jgi:hypothetical protein
MVNNMRMKINIRNVYRKIYDVRSHIPGTVYYDPTTH